MKILILLLTSIATLAQTAVPLDRASLTWNRNPEPDIAGYHAYIAQGTNVWSSFTTNNIIKLNLIKPDIQPGTYSFFVRAQNNAGLVSDPSATITTNLAKTPSIPTGLSFIITSVTTNITTVTIIQP